MEDYRKINKWIEIHWKTILIIVSFTIALIIPVIVYKSAIRFAFDKNISANHIFTGLIAYCGIIISFFGIYWKTTREESLKIKENEKLVNNLFYFVYEKIMTKYSENSKQKICLDKIYKDIMHIVFWGCDNNQEIFSTLDEEIIKRKLDSIIVLKKGKELLNYNEKFNGINDLIKSIILENRLKSITEKMRYIYKESKYGQILKTEMEIIELLKCSIIQDLTEKITIEMEKNLINISKAFNNDKLVCKLYNDRMNKRNQPFSQNNNIMTNYYDSVLCLYYILGEEIISPYGEIITEIYSLVTDEQTRIYEVKMELLNLEEVIEENYFYCKAKTFR